MAPIKFIATLLMIISLVSLSLVTATEYIVGDGSYWTKNFDYQGWAKDKRFYVGDTLVFKYTAPNHNVYKVNATGFQDCVVAAETQALATGNDIITLASPGKKWYICGKPNHCADFGMKLAITVLDGSSLAPAPSTSSTHVMLASWFQVFTAGLVAAGAMIVA